MSVFGSGDYDRKKKSSIRLSGGLCCCVSFWFWQEIGSFFVVAGKFYYDRKMKKFQSSVWRVVLLTENYELCISAGFLVMFIRTGKRKSSSRLSGGLCCCVNFWFWWEIGSFFVVAGKFYYERKKKF